MSTICLGHVQSGAQCKAKTNNANGFCFQHQGQVPPAPAPVPATVTPIPAPTPTPAPAQPEKKPSNLLWLLLGLIPLCCLALLALAGLSWFLSAPRAFPAPTQESAPQADPTESPVPTVPTTMAPTEVPPTPTPIPPTPVPAAPQTNQPQTCGLTFPAYSGGNLDTNYDVRVDCWSDASGTHLRGWQFRLPPERAAHSVAIQIPQGNYVFNGVVCRLFLDEERNGQGSSNPMVAGNGNNLAFTVNVDVAYALIECDGGTPSGFDYWSH